MISKLNTILRTGAFSVVLAAVLLIFLSSCGGDESQNMSPELRGLITSLDSMLDKTSEYAEMKEERIGKLRTLFGKNSSAERKYWLGSDLYDEYRGYDSDSAHVWIRRCIELARQLNRPDLVRDMELNDIYVYSATGMLEEAAANIRRFNLAEASDVQTLRFCERMIFLENHRKLYLGDSSRRNTEAAETVDSLLDRLIPGISSDNPDYCWMLGWYSDRNIGAVREVFPKIDSIVGRESEDSPLFARDTWMLARMYERLGNRDMQLKYLALSAMADLRNSNKEIASLEGLANIMLAQGDLERANRYISHCIECANDYGSRVRLAKLAQMQDTALTEIHRSLQHHSNVNHTLIIVLGVMVVILVLCAAYIIRRNHQLRRSRAEVSEANLSLNRQVAELRETHRQLNESKTELSAAYDKLRATAKELSDVNYAKEEYIANIFELCSTYITKLEDFRSRILSLLKGRRFEDALSIVRSPDLSYDEVKELCANFDKVFLQIYPDFVEDFNTLLRPEERIELKNPRQLTTELRIYALVRLGLNDSMKIARFLHCSVQTVYNTRQRARNKAVVAKEEFAARVQALGKPAI